MITFVIVLSQRPFASSSDAFAMIADSNAANKLSVFSSLPDDPFAWKDIVITEIFPDPTPSVGLPAAEYVEIFNRSGHDISLGSLQLRDENTLAALPDIILHDGEYLVITDASAFFSNANVWGANDFPSLNNDEDILTLQDSTGYVVDSVHYHNSWFDASQRSGGWSLELIDPENTCGASDNWAGSEDTSGGTPGYQNSVFALKPDLTAPNLLQVATRGEALVLSFDENLGSLPDNTSFHVEPELTIRDVSFTDGSLQYLKLILDDSLNAGVTYKISVTNVTDCAGNIIPAEHNTRTFGKPEQAVNGDIVINEVLFNPRPGGNDFIELFNASSKFINLNGWQVSNIDDGITTDPHFIFEKDFLFEPGAFLVITNNIEVIMSDYPKSIETNVIEIDALPRMNDDQGSIALMTMQDSVIDQLAYNDDMHSVFIKDAEGVSLERLSSSRESNDNGNWHSASSDSGFATPGYINSNSVPPSAVGDDAVRIEPAAFIPLLGQPSFTEILYQFDQGGNIGNVTIHDERGRIVKRLANNLMLGTTGALRWDGDRDDGYKARVGYYLIHFEIFNSSGEVRTYNKGVAIAARF